MPRLWTGPDTGNGDAAVPVNPSAPIDLAGALSEIAGELARLRRERPSPAALHAARAAGFVSGMAMTCACVAVLLLALRLAS